MCKNLNPQKLGANEEKSIDKIPLLFMMVGLPGSGKSTYAEHIITPNGKPIIHSSDKLREELYGDVDSQEHNGELFVELHRRIKNDLKNGKDVVYDATNISKKRRMAFLRELNNIQCHRICITIMTPYDMCLEYNRARQRVVPDEVINRMIKNWNPPDYTEGFENIILVFNVSDKELYSTKWKLTTLFCGDCGINNFQQENSHHTLTLGEHCRKAADYIIEHDENNFVLQVAALLHDEGKIMTKSRLNSKGEDDGNCHYYQHHCVGAYDSMFYTKALGLNDDNVIYISNLIYYHMHPYMAWQQSKSVERRHRIQMGDKMYEDILLLHEADVNAH